MLQRPQKKMRLLRSSQIIHDSIQMIHDSMISGDDTASTPGGAAPATPDADAPMALGDGAPAAPGGSSLAISGDGAPLFASVSSPHLL